MMPGRTFVRGNSRRAKSRLKSALQSFASKKWRVYASAAVLGLFFIMMIRSGGGGGYNLQWGAQYPFEHPRLVKQPMDSDEIMKMDQMNPKLWDHIKKNHIIPPSNLPYYTLPRGPGLGENNTLDLNIIHKSVDYILHFLLWNRTGGVFVDAGAFDGVYSHSFFWEATMNWTGLLIECHPKLLPHLRSVNRKAYIADVCLSKEKHSEKGRLISMDSNPSLSTLTLSDMYFPEEVVSNYTAYEVQTYPLFSILAAVDFTEVDLFVLNVNGYEMEILRNFPFYRFFVKVWVIGVEFFDIHGQHELQNFMHDQGYSKDRYWNKGMDIIFVHEAYQSLYKPNNETLAHPSGLPEKPPTQP